MTTRKRVPIDLAGYSGQWGRMMDSGVFAAFASGAHGSLTPTYADTAQVHRAWLANVRAVAWYDGRKVTMPTGETLSVSARAVLPLSAASKPGVRVSHGEDPDRGACPPCPTLSGLWAGRAGHAGRGHHRAG